MTKREKADLKKQITSEINLTKKSIEECKEMIKPIAPDKSLGRLTRMDALNQKGMNEIALSNAVNTLRNLERALPLIDQDDFGVCRKCGNDIPVERLKMVPGTAMCVACIETNRRQ